MIENAIRQLLATSLAMLPLLGALHLLAYAILRRRPLVVAASVLLLAFLVFVFKPLSTVLPYLGTDSFREGVRFDLAEARFYLSTLGYGGMHWKTVALWCGIYAAYATWLAGFALLVRRRRLKIDLRRVQKILITLLLVLPLAYSLSIGARGFILVSQELDRVANNFSGHAEEIIATADQANDLSVVLYIGESASRMNWSLYGYPRATTPALDQLMEAGELVRFENVRATHPYTSNSLLEALSIQAPIDRREGPLPIVERKRISIVDVLNRAGVSTSLFSNQGRFGT